MAGKATAGAGSDQNWLRSEGDRSARSRRLRRRWRSGHSPSGYRDVDRTMVGAFARPVPESRADTVMLEQGDRIVCEAAHIRQDSLRAVPGNGFAAGGLMSKQGLAIRIREGRMMAQRPQPWSSGDGERRWLLALIDAMERVSRRDVRAVPCDRQLLAAMKVRLTRPMSSYRTWQDSARRARRAV